MDRQSGDAIASTQTGYVRTFTEAPASNRLQSLTSSSNTYAYIYDPCGNLTSETTSRLFEWDHADRLATYRTQPTSSAEPSIYTQYRYDSYGQRLLKVTRNQGGALRVTIYIDATPPVLYQLGDHLGSCEVVLDSAGDFVNREEFLPYGETSFGSYARKRYRFTGKERDEESSLYYYGARYYAPWLCRWTTPDPAGLTDGLSLYCYVHDNPVRHVDSTGRQTEPPAEASPPQPSLSGTETPETATKPSTVAGPGGASGSATNPRPSFGETITVTGPSRAARLAMGVSGRLTGEWGPWPEQRTRYETVVHGTLSPPLQTEGLSPKARDAVNWLWQYYPQLFPHDDLVIREGDPGKGNSGVTDPWSGVVTIDPKLNLEDTVNTIAHELMHSRLSRIDRLAHDVRVQLGNVGVGSGAEEHHFIERVGDSIESHFNKRSTPGFDPRSLADMTTGQAVFDDRSVTLRYTKEKFGSLVRVDERWWWESLR